METRKEEIEKRLFETLEKTQKIEDTQDWAHKENIEHKNSLVGLLKAHSLEGGALRVEQFKKEMWELTDGGKDVLANGSPELRLLRAIPKEGSIAKADLQKEHPDLMKSGFAECMKNKWIVLAGPAISRAEGVDAEAMHDSIQDTLVAIEKGEKVPDKKDETVLKNRRKLIRFV